MKSKFLFIIIILLSAFTACDDISNNVVDSATDPVNITSINVPKDLVYKDSPVRLSVKLTVDNSDGINSMWFKVRYHDGSFTTAPKVDMKDNGDTENNNDLQAGDNTYSGFTEMTDENPHGTYTIEIYMLTTDAVQKKIALSNFTYETYVENVAPVVSDLMAPDTLVVTDTLAFRMTIKASDENGQQDISSVYFITTKPDSTSNGYKFQMYDSGSMEEHGDEVKDDGIYSIIVKVNSDNQKGTYRFDFQAQDRSGAKSQILSHNIVLM